MLSIIMKSQGQSFLRSAISQIIENKEEINTTLELENAFSILQYILSDNEYLISSVSIDDIEVLPISKEEIERYVYYSLPPIVINDEEKFKKEIDNSMKKLNEVY